MLIVWDTINLNANNNIDNKPNLCMTAQNWTGKKFY